jgi:hypothetical protein
MDTLGVRELLQALPSLRESFLSGGNDSVSHSWMRNVQNDELENLYLDTVLVDLMGRYGRVSSHFDSQSDHQACRLNLSQVPTIAAGLIGSGDVDCDQEILSFQEQDLTVRLILERARGVGRVDLLSGADLYCAAFVGYWGQDQGNGENAGNMLFQTSIRRGKSEEEWTWNEVGSIFMMLSNDCQDNHLPFSA